MTVRWPSRGVGGGPACGGPSSGNNERKFQGEAGQRKSACRAAQVGPGYERWTPDGTRGSGGLGQAGTHGRGWGWVVVGTVQGIERGGARPERARSDLCARLSASLPGPRGENRYT